jgi:DNA-binding response OmpR family regulator
MLISDDAQSHKSKLVYLWPALSKDMREAARQLSYYGYQAELIDTPEQLIRDAETEPPTGILIDCSLAGELTAPLKAELTAIAQRLPVACISDLSDVHARLAAVRMGCQAYFTRPIDAAALLDTLDRMTAPPQAEAGKVLIVDDSASLAAFYAAHLSEAGFVCQVVSDPLKCLDAILEHPPELILLDMNMPGASGQEIAKVIRQQDTYLSIPIVFL